MSLVLLLQMVTRLKIDSAVFLNIIIINDEALSGSARFVLQLR